MMIIQQGSAKTAAVQPFKTSTAIAVKQSEGQLDLVSLHANVPASASGSEVAVAQTAQLTTAGANSASPTSWLLKAGGFTAAGAALLALPSWASAATASATTAAAPVAHSAASTLLGMDSHLLIGVGIGAVGMMALRAAKSHLTASNAVYDTAPRGPRTFQPPDEPYAPPTPPKSSDDQLGVKGGGVHRVVKTEKTLQDVAGIPGAMAEINEIVDFIKNPGKYEQMGAKIPRGVLMDGEPGTGKSHLAECIAGEAGVPMLAINGSDLDEKLVGVGASRVRTLFADAAQAVQQKSPDAAAKQQKAMEAAQAAGKELAAATLAEAAKNGACIIFVDEIDSFGKKRSSDGSGGGSEQTLNAFLTEMSGVGAAKGIVVIAATNRPDMLDPALTRSGRFDRKINVPRPNLEGRLAILGVHSRKVPLENAKDLEHIAARSTGLVGADMANIINEAAISAVRDGKNKVNLQHLSQALDKVVMGAHRVGTVLSDQEKKETAYHEAGHAMISKLLPSNGDVQKMSILPRGRALGVCWTTPAEERVSKKITDMEDSICMLLGGRAAEEVTFGANVSTGASNDIERATEIARQMVCTYGMSKLGLAQISDGRGPGIIPSEANRTAINDQIQGILDKQYTRAKGLLTSNDDTYQALAKALHAKEELDRPELDAIFAGLKTAA